MMIINLLWNYIVALWACVHDTGRLAVHAMRAQLRAILYVHAVQYIM